MLHNSAVLLHSYNIVFLVLTYGIPMIIMVVSYSIMGRELWGSRSIGEQTQRQKEAVKSKKKVRNIYKITSSTSKTF